MNLIPTLALYLLVFVVIAVCVRRYRALSRQLVQTQLEAARLGRHMARLELALKEVAPDVFAHVKGRSDMEWQQATSRLAEGQLPDFFPLETSYLPLGALRRAE